MNEKEQAQQILAAIQKYETIIIHRHKRPDPDAIGAQVGLKEMLKENFPQKQVYAVGGDVEGLAFLSGMDEIPDTLYQGALVIVVDTANTDRISDERYKMGDFLIKLDHHPNDEPYGDVFVVDTEKSSASELIANLSRNFSWRFNAEAARLFYAGIVGDTGRFLYPSTRSETFQMASFLRTFDFDAGLLNRQLEQVSMKVARLCGYVYQHIEVDAFGAGRVMLEAEVLEMFGVEDAETAHVVALPGNVDELVAWGIFVAQQEGPYPYRVRLRSKGPAINEIAKKHHGGGHPLASGANARSIEECQEIYEEIQQVLRHAKNDK